MMKRPRKAVVGILTAIGIFLAAGHAWARSDGQVACRVVQQGKQLELRSPFFVFCLDAAAGLRARSWENRLAAQTLTLGDGPELEIDIGLPDRPLQTPPLEVSSVQVQSEGDAGELIFTLAAKEPPISALVTYRWDAKQPVLRKFVEITNKSDHELSRLLNVRLGTYHTNASITEREQGFPVYLNQEFFLSLAHPAGWAMGKDGNVSLKQYPGTKLAPGGRFECMESVYGVAKAGEAQKTFVAHVRSRMRRVVRGHDKVYAIFEPFGARPGGDFNETEEFVRDMIAKVARGQQDSGCHFDFFSLDFWVDYHGDLKRCDPKRFPNGLTKIKEGLAKLDTGLGLWIDSSYEAWSIGGNPAVQNTLNYDPKESSAWLPWGRKSFCRATEFLLRKRRLAGSTRLSLIKNDASLSSWCFNNHEGEQGCVERTKPC